MDLEILAAPVLALIIGLISLMMGGEGKYQKLLTSLLVLALIAVCYLGVTSNLATSQETQEQKSIATTLLGQNSQLTKLLTDFKQDTGFSLESIIDKLNHWLINPANTSTAILKESVLANQSMEIYSTGIPTNTKTEIKYYVKEIDNSTVLDALIEKGLQVTRGKATLDQDITNAIWFGENVSIQEVKYVAMVLIRAGVEIKTIKPYSGERRKVHTIEIGSDRSFSNSRSISVAEVNQAEQFIRPDTSAYPAVRALN